MSVNVARPIVQVGPAGPRVRTHRPPDGSVGRSEPRSNRAASPATKRPVLLVVEDDPVTGALLRNLFAEADYEVVQAADGAAALATLETLSPALVTLDLDLPDMPGADVLKRLRERRELRSVRVVIISGQPKIPARARRLAHAVVRKPFDVGELLAIVRALVPPGPGSSAG